MIFSWDIVMDSLVTVCLTIAMFTLLYIYRKKQSDKYPPGPTRFPIVGNIPQIVASGDLVKFLQNYRKIYGEVYTIEIGGVINVVISGYDNCHQLLIKNADYTSSRSPEQLPPPINELAKVTPGLFWAPYPQWKNTRTFMLNVLREEGMGKVSMEPKILTEVDQFVAHFIEPHIGQPLVLNLSLTYATSNIISQMAIGRRFDYDNSILQNLNSAVADAFIAMLKASITRKIPFVKYLPGDLTGQKLNAKADTYIMNTMQEIIDKMRSKLDEEDQHNIVSQALLLERADREKGITDTMFSDKNITIMAIQLYSAGTESTSIALNWALLYMILYPEIQERVRQEIYGIIGERQVSMKDILKLPYTDAVLIEVLRCANVAPTGISRQMERDIVLDGKTVPAGCNLLFNMHSLLNDPDLYPQPEIFNPDRFIGPDAQTLKSKLLLFGLGRRSCLGESLARMEYFLFFVTFLQKYKLSYPSNKKPNLEPWVGITRAPQKYEIVFDRC